MQVAKDLMPVFDLVAVLVLVVITAWYARSTAQMLRELRHQARLLAISVEASVEAGLTSLPPPGQASAAASEACANLQSLRKEIWALKRSAT